MDNCLFCKIAAGEIPSDRVYEDDKILGFRDIDPQAPVHVLLIPKDHITSAAALNHDNSGVVAHIFEIIGPLAAELGMENGFRVVSNVGTQGGQSVPHLHFHLLGGRDMTWPPG